MAVTVTRARQREFPGLPEQISAARAWAVSCLPAGCPRADDVALVVSELVTNAGRCAWCRLDWSAGTEAGR